MNFAVSVVLAASAILSTIMLQLGDENGDAGLMIAISAFAVIGAVYYVDLKKKFYCSKATCNVLMLLAVFANVGSLTRSREEFLAFSIANILTLLEAINFYRRKTPRVCYQILTMSFVKVAVGCVFQRSPLFAVLLPLYGACGFCAFSLLFLVNERRYYAQNAELSPRFDRRGWRPTREDDGESWDFEGDSPGVANGRKTLDERAKKLEKRREKARLRVVEKAARRAKSAAPPFAVETSGGSAVRFALLTEPARFSSSVGLNAESGVDLAYFRRFGRASFAALAVASILFCLFPRFHRLEIGGLEFGSDDWKTNAAGATTGFSPEIELGDLGPAVYNPAPALTIRFVDVFNPKSEVVLSPGAFVYLRGVALGRYEDRTWEQIDAWNGDWAWSVSDTRFDILRRTEIDPESVLGPERNDFEKTVVRGERTRRGPREFARTPFFYFAKGTVPTTRPFEEFDSLEKMRDALPPRRELEARYLFDYRSNFLGMEIALEPSDAPYLFAVSPFFSDSESTTRFGYVGAIPCRPRASVRQKTTYRFLTTAFQNGVQAPLTPNQEFTTPLLADYLELDAERFPRLIELARSWDAASGLPQDDFVGRARFLESRLRDVGDFTYSRTGVERNSELDPLEDFVSEHRSGHCEYFAGALALMLRAVGIPSRTVVGYAFLPKDGGVKKTVVRQSDAHSWTEAFIPAEKLPGPNSPAAGLFAGNVPNGLPEGTREWTKDGAWLRLDATPPARLAEQTHSWATVGASWLLFFESIWRDYVLNFNGSTQAVKVYRPIVDAWKRTVATLKNFRTEFRPLKAFADKAKEIGDQIKSGDWTPRAVGNFLWFAAQIAVVGYVFFRLFRFFRARFFGNRRDAVGVRRRRPGAENAFALYRRVETILSRRLTVERRPNETPREFVERCFALDDENAVKLAAIEKIEKTGKSARTAKKEKTVAAEPVVPTFEPISPEARRLFREIVERYYRARFGEDALSAEEAARWNVELRGLGAD